jgi:hypothetical protein
MGPILNGDFMTAKAKPGKKTKQAPKKAKAVKKLKAAKAKGRKVDPLIAEMGREIKANSRPSMFGQSGGGHSKLVQLVEGDDAVESFYKNMLFKCVKCDGSFDHKAKLPLVAYEVKCPHCSEVHVLRFKPTSRLFTVNSKTLDVLDDKK